jgi:hypothetical protein
MNSMQLKNSFVRLVAAAAAMAALAGCSSGGAPTVENPQTVAPPVADYTGPAPANADVQAFRIALWENIKPNNRCSSCHNAGGQTPTFARNDDVNLAYQQANSVVNLQQPDQSRLVTKVASGHNCWLAAPSACADTMTVWIRNWAGATAVGGREIQLVAPPIKEVGGSKSFPASSALFASTVWPLLRNPATANCSRCHASSAGTPQQPFFADGDIDAAYAAVKSKINLDAPASSRLVVRLRDEFHNCWGDCPSNSATMQAAIQAFADGVPITEVDPNLVISKGLTLYDGTVAAGGNRYDANVIALYEFKTGMGNIAYDTSGHEPSLNLTMSGDIAWVGGWGLNVKMGGKAQGTAAASKKLSDLIKSTGEFSIEAWANNANVAQEDAYIVSYSAGIQARNATLAQQMYQYEGYTRSSVTGANGNPTLITRAADMDAQAALQHVVMTYSPQGGRRIYVNGVYTGDADAQGGGSLADWDDTFALVLGNETSTNRQWEGVLRLVAVHNRALTEEQINQNFVAGVGERYFLLFNVSHLVSIPEAYLMLEGSQLDSYAYQFNKPTFISLNAGAQTQINNLTIKGIRIGINGLEAHAGQAYVPLDATVGGSNYVANEGQQLSNVGTTIALEKGPGDDLLFLSFEQIGTNSHTPVEPPVVTPDPPPDSAPEADIGLRTFDELNATLSLITGVPQTNSRVVATYSLVKQALPTIEKFATFGPAQQTALAQLAIQYCNVLVEDGTRRQTFFGNVNVGGSGTAVFGNAGSPNTTNRNQIIDALLSRGVGSGLTVQPTDATVRAEINVLIDKLNAGPTGSANGGASTVVKAACGAVLGSGTTLVQ